MVNVFVVLRSICLKIVFLLSSLPPPDPFADATKGDDRLPAGTEDYIHIKSNSGTAGRPSPLSRALPPTMIRRS
ncbi:hypothetical protein FQN60_000071 [Etheostoma spectabile]|uniref:Secreted protein n=1 Tax=Etheostoma spectabile TaxID=54343 RepID=A0A5J5C9R7_9PERO|nr:hypothetical protein FQN60_000071 [Etheostoma spectabile]